MRKLKIAAAIVLCAGVALAVPTTVQKLRALFAGGIIIGSAGTAIPASYAGSATYDFGALSGPGTALNTVCADSDAITVTGAALGDVCSLGSSVALSNAGLVSSCYVSAADAVKVRMCAAGITDGGTINLADATYKVRVFTQ